MRAVIVNADDFGLSAGVNRGVVRAHDDGIVTSASLMVRQPAARDAVALAADRPALSLGLHVDLGEWVFRDAEWTPVYEVVSLEDAGAIEAELERQLATFRELAGREPTHLDSHQHVHRSEPVRSLMLARAEMLVVPLRGASPQVHYCGAFYGQSGGGDPYPDGVSVEHLVRVLEGLPEGITELGCHPGEERDWVSTYTAEREIELETLCDPRVQEAIRRLSIELLSFVPLGR